MATTRANGTIYQLKVTLKYSKPPIWRRMLVPASTKLADLHIFIQAYMGWDDSHLHLFESGGVTYAPPSDDLFGFENGDADERRVALKDLLMQEKQKLRYTYDFGDNWEHDILLEKILPRKRGEAYPQLIAGKRHCPPDDSGGVWGYAAMLEALESPEHPEHETYLEWLGEEFDPEEFDLNALQSRLVDDVED